MGGGGGWAQGHEDDEGLGACELGGEAERACIVQPRKDVQGHLIHVHIYLMSVEFNNMEPDSFNSIWTKAKRWLPTIEIQEIPFKHEKEKSLREHSNTGPNFQRGCAVSTLGDIQHLVSHDPEQPTFGDLT